MATIDLLTGWPGWATEFALLWRQEQSRQANGVTRVKDFGDPLWQATYTTRRLSPNELDYWRARLNALDNGVQTFYGQPLSRCYPIAYPNGVGLDADGWFPAKTWNFATDVEGWSAAGGTLTAAGGTISMAATVAAEAIISPSFSIDGSKYNRVRFRVRKTAGGGTGWGGGYAHVVYSTTDHGFIPGTYEKAIPVPTDISQWSTIDLDMSDLSGAGDAGDDDWINSTITGLRLYTVGLDQTVEFDWIDIGNDTFPGEARVASAPAGGSIPLKGLPVGYVLSVGDYIEVAGADLYQIVGGDVAASDGTATVTVRPYVWSGTAVDDAVSLVRPHCVMTIVPGSISSTADLSTGRGSVSFQAVEAR